MRKLYRLTASDFQLPLAILSDDNYISISASYIPMLRYPDGSWCHYSNCYMHSLFEKGLSRNNNGGTLKTYAGNISHLLRYCWNNSIDISQMTDNLFVLFMQSMLSEKNNITSTKSSRSNTTILTIGRNCIDLLAHTGKIKGIENFVGKNGVIKAEKKRAEIDISNGARKLIKYYWHHRSFPKPSPEKKRFPITENHAKAIVSAAAKTDDLFRRKRRFVMLKLLEHTGCRRSELVKITTRSVYAALNNPSKGLEVPTAKTGGNKPASRYLPISLPDLKFIASYIEYNRNPKIKILSMKDEGFLLINSNTGGALNANTITQEISELATAADIHERLSPHMYRHRFITQYFIKLILQHNFENPDEFRNLLVNTESFKQEIQQWTGHKRLSSLDPYIKIAFGDITNRKEVASAAIRSQHISSLRQTIKMTQDEIKAGFSIIPVGELLESISDYLKELE
ncbi:tyrosine-type recombinase/integrase [Pseudomonas sp. MDT1-17]